MEKGSSVDGRRLLLMISSSVAPHQDSSVDREDAPHHLVSHGGGGVYSYYARQYPLAYAPAITMIRCESSATD